MKRFAYLGPLLAVPAVVVILAAIPGCPSGKDKDKTAVPKGPPVGVSAKIDGGEKGAKAGKGDPIVVKTADATIKGRVLYDGDPPAPVKLKIDKDHADKDLCHAGPDLDPTWIISKDKGVADAIVYLDPGAGKFFALDEKEADKFKSNPTIDQPYCVYQPSVLAVFAAFKTQDGKLHQTGAKLMVKNSSEKLSHNTKLVGDGKNNETIDKNINPGTKDGVPYDVNFQKSEIPIQCTKHTWMSATLKTFDHPFFAVTDKDGNFEMKNVPSGLDATLKVWHKDATPAEGEVKTKGGVNDVQPLKIKTAG
jgi:hypothetical protein